MEVEEGLEVAAGCELVVLLLRVGLVDCVVSVVAVLATGMVLWPVPTTLTRC